jgi:hypothetical protein
VCGEEPRRSDERERGPRERACERQRDRDARRGDRHRQRQAAHRGGDPAEPLLPQEPPQTEAGQDRVQHDDRAEPVPARERRRRAHPHHVQPARLRIGQERRPGHLERVPQRQAALGEGVAEQTRAGEPEGQDVGVLVGQVRQEGEAAQGDQDRDDDERGASDGDREAADR